MQCNQPIISHDTKLIGRHIGYANEGQVSNISLFCVLRTSNRIHVKFGVHIECDQPIIFHNNAKYEI